MKKTIQFLAVMTAFTFGVARASLISHYTFDETSGTTAVDSGAAGANGTIGSNVTIGAAGKSGNAYTFNNDATQAGIVDMGNAATFAALNGSQKVTVSVWLKWTTPGSRDCAIFFGDNTSATRYLDVGTTSSGSAYGRTRNVASTGAAFPDLPLGSGLNDEQWHHVAYTADAAAGVTQLYIDCILAGSTSTPLFTFPAFNNFEIGRLGRGTPTDAYAGSVDELRIYDEVLSSNEIATLAGLTVSNPGLGVPASSSFINKGKLEIFSVPFSNTGTSQILTLTGSTPITISGPDAGQFTVASYDNNLSPGASGNIRIKFTPEYSGIFTATLTIASNDSLHSTKEVNVSVEVKDPVAVATPAALDFGSFASVSQPQTRTITITNEGGNANLEVFGLNVVGSAAFSVEEEFPHIVAPGQHVAITVIFNPAGAEGRFSGSLEVNTDGYIGSYFSIPLSAAVKLSDPDASLVSHFTFDDPAGLGNDRGSFHNNGTPVGDAQRSPSARIGTGALSLDGVGDFIDLGTVSGATYTSRLVDDEDGFTVACWANVPTGTTSDRVRFFSTYANGAATLAEGWGVGRRNTSGVLVGTTYGKADYLPPGNSAPATDTWHHYAYVFRSTPVNRVDFYVNGVLVSTQATTTTGFTDASSVGFAIGALGRSTAFEGFDGRLDDLRIYSKELLADNIADLYNSAPPESAYGVWSAGYGLDATGDGARLADPDGDGLANSIEYVLGSSPVSGVTSYLPLATRSGDNLVVVHRRKIAAAAEGFLDHVEYSDILHTGSWTTAVHGVGGVTISKAVIDAETEEVTTSIPTPGNKRFARLKVVTP